MNQDGIPELFLRTESGQEVYTYHNGKIVFMESFMAGHMLQYFDKGNILRSGRLSYGTLYEGIYQLFKTKLKGVASCSTDEEGENGEYSVKQKKVSKKKYDAYVKQISKKSKYHDVEYHSISQENLKKYL